MGGYDFKETLARFSQILRRATPLTTHRAASPPVWYPVCGHLRCTTLVFAAHFIIAYSAQQIITPNPSVSSCDR